MEQPGPDNPSETTVPTSPHAEQLHCIKIGTGPHNILLLHGFAASAHTWDELVPFFPPDKFTLHLLELKGHGDSTTCSGNDYSPQYNALLTAAHIRSHGLKDVTLIGHSLGGIIGLLSAMDCPEITRLILLDAPVFPQKIPRFMRLLRLPFIGPLLLSAIPAEKIARKGLEAVFHRPERITGQLIERYAAVYRRKGSARALARTVRQIIPPSPAALIARYKTISIPVLLLWGENDRVVKPWQAERLDKELQNSQLILIPDCGHNPHEERPEQAYTLIQDFLSGGVLTTNHSPDKNIKS